MLRRAWRRRRRLAEMAVVFTVTLASPSSASRVFVPVASWEDSLPPTVTQVAGKLFVERGGSLLELDADGRLLESGNGDPVLSLLEAPGLVVVATASRVFIHTENETTSFGAGDLPGFLTSAALLPGPQPEILLGTTEGLYRWDGASVVEERADLAPTALVVSEDGKEVLLATSEILVRLRAGEEASWRLPEKAAPILQIVQRGRHYYLLGQGPSPYGPRTVAPYGRNFFGFDGTAIRAAGGSYFVTDLLDWPVRGSLAADNTAMILTVTAKVCRASVGEEPVCEESRPGEPRSASRILRTASGCDLLLASDGIVERCGAGELNRVVWVPNLGEQLHELEQVGGRLYLVTDRRILVRRSGALRPSLQGGLRPGTETRLVSERVGPGDLALEGEDGAVMLTWPPAAYAISFDSSPQAALTALLRHPGSAATTSFELHSGPNVFFTTVRDPYGNIGRPDRWEVHVIGAGLATAAKTIVTSVVKSLVVGVVVSLVAGAFAVLVAGAWRPAREADHLLSSKFLWFGALSLRTSLGSWWLLWAYRRTTQRRARRSLEKLADKDGFLWARRIRGESLKAESQAVLLDELLRLGRRFPRSLVVVRCDEPESLERLVRTEWELHGGIERDRLAPALFRSARLLVVVETPELWNGGWGRIATVRRELWLVGEREEQRLAP